MVAGAEVMVPVQQTITALDVPCCSDVVSNSPDTTILQFVPSIRSGSFADIGPRRFMEDEHIRIDDLSAHQGSLVRFPKPCAFYGVFDGHGGPEAAAYLRKHVLRFLFEETNFPQTSEVDDTFLKEVKKSVREGFLLADLALAAIFFFHSQTLRTTLITAISSKPICKNGVS